MDKFETSLSDPQAGNYLINPEFDTLTAEEIVDKALAYKPIQL